MTGNGPWRLSLGIGLLLLSLAAVGAGAEEGDSRRGEALYVGTVSFAQGAAPCLACHGIAGAGLGRAAGASYGPDLTGMWENFGPDGIEEVLATMPFPSMEAIYAQRPLTDAERRDLAAYLQEVSGRETPRIAGALLVQTGAGLGVCFLILALFGRNRCRPADQVPSEPYCRQEGGE